MQDILPTIGLARAVGDVDVAPAVTADGQPAVAIWAGNGDEPAILTSAEVTLLVLALADAEAHATTTTRGLDALRRLL